MSRDIRTTMKKYFTLKDWIDFLTDLGRKGGKIIHFQTFIQKTGFSPDRVRKAIVRLEKKGYLERIGKKLYANNFLPPTLEEIAMAIYPCYISFESALEKTGIISQIPFVLTCATIEKTKLIETPYGSIQFHHIKSELFWGFINENGILWAEPEKAFLDYLYLSRKTKGGFPSLDEIDWEKLDIKKLYSYAQKFPKSVLKTIKSYKA